MKFRIWVAALTAGILTVSQFVAWSAEGGKIWQVQNSLKAEYDDNIRTADTNEESSFKIIDEAEFHINLNMDNTFASVRYRPSFVWWDNRPEDDSDIHHSLDAILSHRFSERFSVNVSDTFRVQEQPELIERGTVVRADNDYIYNDFSAGAQYGITPDTHIDVNGRYLLLDYDAAAIAETQNYDLMVLGLNIGHLVAGATQVRGELRYEDTAYDSTAVNRDSSSIYVGGAVEQAFSPNLLGSVRAGFQSKDIDDPAAKDPDSPYVDVSTTILPSPATRITAGVGFSQFEGDVYPYANQEQLRFFASVAHDITARLAGFLTASISSGDYDVAEKPAEAADTPVVVDGSDEVILLGARAAYRVNRSNWIEIGWLLTSLNSDLRADYDRNRFNIGWKTQL